MKTLHVRSYLLSLQEQFLNRLQEIDPELSLDQRILEDERSYARPSVFTSNNILEKGACNFTHAQGASLPQAATVRKPELAGCGFQAASLSWIIHPKNPYAPTCHGNLRYFEAAKEGALFWWFGGGIDLTPYYGFIEDAVHWHKTAQEACDPYGPELYQQFKENCDSYFYLPHRKETRGVGGLFFEDLMLKDWETTFAFVRSVGDSFLPAYLPILNKRIQQPYGARERAHQLYRRGRYVEFNLLYDRGTHYGLQSGRRIESVLSSMPPIVHFNYDHRPEPNSEEAKLTEYFLKPQDWLELIKEEPSQST